MKSILTLLVLLSMGLCIALSIEGCSKQSADKLTGGAICDTNNISYSKQIVSILQDNCYSCHGHNSTVGSGGVDLSSYDAVSAYAADGFLVGNVTHAPGFNPMPYGGPMLPTCEINTIIAWVNQGAKNN